MIAGSLEIQLLANIARLQADMDRARQVVGGAMERISSAVNVAKTALVAFVAAAATAAIASFVGSIVGLVRGCIDAADSLNDLSKSTSISVENLSGLKLAATQSGGSLDGIAASVNKLSTNMGKDAAKFKALGVTAKEPLEAFKQLADVFSAIRDPQLRAALGAEALGKSWAEAAPLLAEGGKKIGEMIEKGKALSGVNQEMAERADALNDKLAEFSAASEGAKMRIVNDMLPAFIEITTAITKAYEESGKLAAAWAALQGAGRFLFTDDFSSETVKLKNLRGELDTLKNYQLNAKESIPVLGYLLWGSEGSWDAEIAKKKAQIADFMKVQDAARVEAEKKANDKAAKQAEEAAAADAAKRATAFLGLNKEAENAEAKRLKTYRDLTTVIDEQIIATAREAAGMEPLNAAQKEMIKVTAELKSGKLQLLPVEQEEIKSRIRQWEANLASIESQKALLKMNDELVKAEKMMAGDRESTLKKAVDEADANEELARTFGMTKAAIEELQLARLEEQLAQRASTGLTLDEIEHLEKLIVAKKRSAGAAATLDGLEEQKAMWESIDKTAHDTFVSIFDSGKSAFDRLRDTLKNGVLDLLYQMTIKKWIFNIGASVGLSGAGGLAQAANAATGGAGVAGSNGLIGMAQAASTAYKAITMGFEGLSTSVANGVQSAMSAVGYYPSAASGLASGTGQALTPFASGAGAAASYLAGAAAGKVLGSAISGDYGIGGHGSAVVNIATIAGSIFGGPIGGAIGGAIGGLFNRAFGMGSTELKNQGISGSISSNGLTGSSYQNMHQDGGWFRSDKNWTDTKALSAEVVAQFTQGFDAIKGASAGFATALGASVDSIASYSKDFNITLTGDAEANKKAVTEFFAGVGDEIALRLVPNLAQFSKTGETVSATLERLAGDFQATNQVAMLMGVSGKAMFGSLGVDSAAARERLIDLTGGVSNLSAQANTFAQNYLTEAERLAPVSEAVAAAMASLGMASVTTREQFKEVVQGLDVTTAAGAQQFASMMALADSFAQVHPLIEATTAAMRTEADILSERKDLQKQFDQATMTSAQLRAKERLAIDASNLALFDQITNLQTIAATSDALKTSIDKLKSFKDGVLSFRDSLTLGSLSTLNPMQKAAEAQRQYEDMLAKARAGDETARAGIQGAATAYLTADQIVKASSDAYVNDAMKVQADLMALADAAGAQISVDQLQLTALDSQVTQMTTLNAKVEGLRDDNAKLREDNAKLIAAVQDQTAVLATVIAQSADANAAQVNEGTKTASMNRNYKLNLDAEAIPV